MLSDRNCGHHRTHYEVLWRIRMEFNRVLMRCGPDDRALERGLEMTD
jgi:hypothetical protein